MCDEVELTDRAVSDLNRLADSLALHWPEGVDRLTDRFHAALTRLESFPLSCGIAYENRFFSVKCDFLGKWDLPHI